HHTMQNLALYSNTDYVSTQPGGLTDSERSSLRIIGVDKTAYHERLFGAHCA
ncbi:MAG: hypothetical protein GWP70_13975, partial [Proteobacteria bacterium]|nr:hypothetical protein [Pseudomonadota bacterium]